VLLERMVSQAKWDHRALQDPMVAWDCLGRKENRWATHTPLGSTFMGDKGSRK